MSNKINWFEIWFQDKQGMIDIMTHNMVSDLNAGYDYFGKSITQQREEIAAYKAKFDAEVNSFKNMDDAKVNRWCYYDLKKRGAIS